MTRLFIITMILVTAGLATSARDARADRRSFLETYEYMTMPEGDLELEFWNRETRAAFASETARSYELEIEVEYGITSHWDIALYQVFGQVDDPVTPAGGQPFGYRRTNLETRYRLGERGSSPVDTLLYFEIEKAFGEDKWGFEPKLILARDFGKLTAVVNIIPEIELETEEEPSGETELEVEFEPGWSVGVSYEVSPKLKIGAETFGAVTSPFSDAVVEAFAGPSVSWAPSHKVWIATTAAFGLTTDTDAFLLGFIIGLGI